MKFMTQDGINVPSVNTLQMIEIDRIAMHETGPNLFQMMENAGRNLCLLCMEKLADKWRTSSILVLAGSGSNGGGGICAARHLANHGVDVRVCLTDPENLKEIPAYQLHLLGSTPAKIISLDELQNEHPVMIIDAIIGYSLTGEPSGSVLQMIQWAFGKRAWKLSLDIPSGINSTTGEKAENYFQADATLTLALPKTGLNPEDCGDLYLGDIGIPQGLYKKLNINYIPPFGRSFFIKIEKVI